MDVNDLLPTLEKLEGEKRFEALKYLDNFNTAENCTDKSGGVFEKMVPTDNDMTVPSSSEEPSGSCFLKGECEALWGVTRLS